MPQKWLRFSKNAFLTYPKCDLDPQDIYDQLSVKLRTRHITIKKYIISSELHEDGSPHRHCWIEMFQSPDRVPIDFFDLDGHRKTYHGNYQSMKFTDNCAKYVMKDGEFISNIDKTELDSMKERAKKGCTKMNKEQVSQLLLDGTPLQDVLLMYPALLFDLGKLKDNLLVYRQMVTKVKVLDKLEHEWIYGPTGSGKSKYVDEKYPNHFRKTKDMFWEGYDFEEIVVLEDVDETWEDVLFELKIWADHYPFPARIKHKPSITIRPQKIIITSNYTIHEIMERVFKRKQIKFDEMLIKALERRFTVTFKGYEQMHEDLELFPKGYFYEEKENCPLCIDKCTCKYFDFIDYNHI